MNRQSSAHQTLQWQKNLLLAPYSTFKIGGPAKFFVKVKTLQELQEALLFCQKNKLHYYLLGKGSNTLFDDRGFNGAVILNGLQSWKYENGEFDVESGVSFSYLGLQTAKLGYTGLEYAAGIPGTVGGAIFMNAGANGQEISQLIESVTFMSNYAELRTYSRQDLVFNYRWSSFHDLSGVIVRVRLNLKKKSSARDHQIELICQRKLSQPLSEPSCGCAFRNPENGFAGKIIDQLGLKGLQIGGAQVSPLHGNFIVNKGEASCEDVKNLISKLEDEVYKKTAIKLEREIRYVPYHPDCN